MFFQNLRRDVYWARWGDAVAEAGLQRNVANAKLDEQFFLATIADVYRHFPFRSL